MYLLRVRVRVGSGYIGRGMGFVDGVLCSC